jgi:hypothetical protein
MSVMSTAFAEILHNLQAEVETREAELEKAREPKRTEREVIRDDDGRIVRIIEVAS